jgi:serine/threonine protein kinase
MFKYEIKKDSDGKDHLILDQGMIYSNNKTEEKIEDFEICSKLGKGKKVFKVCSKINNKVYVMKKINLFEIKSKSEKEYNLLFKELEILEKLDNPYIVRYYKSFQKGDYLYLIFEYINDLKVSKLIKAQKKLKTPIKEEEIWKIAMNSMLALAYIHAMGLVHRNIRPKSLFIDGHKRIKIGDFGIYCLNKNNLDLEKNEYKQNDDIYSIGLILYELCYLSLPNEKNNTADNSQLNSLFFSSNNQPVNTNINIQNVGNVHINIYGNKIENIKKEENEENYDEKDEVEEEEIKKEEKKKEKDNKEDKEKIEEEKVSEELNKPDELKSVDNGEYLDLVNQKIKKKRKRMEKIIHLCSVVINFLVLIFQKMKKIIKILKKIILLIIVN